MIGDEPERSTRLSQSVCVQEKQTENHRRKWRHMPEQISRGKGIHRNGRPIEGEPLSLS